MLGKVATSFIFLITSLLVYYMLPFYPLAIAIFLAFIPAIVAYRWPAVALSLLLLIAAPAYSYQLGTTIWIMGILILIAFILPLGLSKMPGAALGAAAGAAAGALMLTPYFVLSLPLLGGITLLRLKGSAASGEWGLLTFLIFYMPFLFLIETPLASGEPVPIYLAVDYARQPVLNRLDLNSLQAAFSGQLNSDFSSFSGFSIYFIKKWSGIVLILALTAAIVAIPTLLNLSKRIRENRIVLRSLVPLLSLLSIELVFLVPLQLLQNPLGYYTGFDNWINVITLTVAMIILGTLGFIIESWFCKRDLKVKLRNELTRLSIELFDLLDKTKKYIKQASLVCSSKEFSDERAAIEQYEEKVSGTLDSASAVALQSLESSCLEFSDMLAQLPTIQLQLKTKLLEHLDDSRRSYKTTVKEALALGIPTIKNMTQTLPPQSAKNDFESIIEEQAQLNNAFKELATNLVSVGDMLASTIKDEIDSEFSLTTIDIGHGFLEQKRFEEAARTISEDLKIIDGRIESPIVELATKVTTMANDFKAVITTLLIPIFESIGDPDSLTKYHNTVEELKTMAQSVQGSRTLADMINIVEHSRKLADMATNTVSELKNRIRTIEAENDRMCPAKYNWGKNSHASGEVLQLLGSIESIQTESTLSSRFCIINKAVQAIERQASVLKQYNQTREFLINYPNIEFMIQEKLRTNMGLMGSELPVKPKYALEYLKMYITQNPDDVIADLKLGTLRRIPSRRTGQSEPLK